MLQSAADCAPATHRFARYLYFVAMPRGTERACVTEMHNDGPELLTLRILSVEGEDTLPLAQPMCKEGRSTAGRNPFNLSPTFAGSNMLTYHIIQSWS